MLLGPPCRAPAARRSALDTLANQASKSDTPKLTSIYTMRTFVVSCMAMPFLYIFLFNGNTIFPLVMPYAEPEMIRHAADYMKVLSLGLPVGNRRIRDRKPHGGRDSLFFCSFWLSAMNPPGHDSVRVHPSISRLRGFTSWADDSVRPYCTAGCLLELAVCTWTVSFGQSQSRRPVGEEMLTFKSSSVPPFG